MTKEEIIAKIEENKTELNSLYPINPYVADKIIDRILTLIYELIEITPSDKLTEGDNPLEEVGFYKVALHELLHTKNKEGSYVHYHYREANKRNAARKREQELDRAFRSLVEHVDSDTFMIGKV